MKLNKIIKKIIPARIHAEIFLLVNNLILRYLSLKMQRKIIARKNTTDMAIFSQIFFYREYKLKLDFRPQLIIDAGANVGYASLWFHLKYPRAEIIAIEPHHDNLKILKQNLEGIKQVKIIPKGLWPFNTKLKILPGSSGECGYETQEAFDDMKENIETITIKEILKLSNKKQIDILKIDIEGAEQELFNRGYKDWLGQVKVLIIELHDQLRPNASKNFYQAINNYSWKKYTQGENLILIKN